MNRLAEKCPSCKRAFKKAKFDQIYCSHRCRQVAYRKRHQARRMRQSEASAAIPTTCDHCNGSFWAKTRRGRFCSTSCRTLYHKALRTAMPQAIMMLYGLPEEKAFDVVETQPIGKLRQLLEAAGYTYQHHERQWMQVV